MSTSITKILCSTAFIEITFFDYEDKHAKHRSQRDDISRGLAPLRCVHGPRTWHKIDESMIDPAKRQGLGPRISYKVNVILYEPLFTQIYNLKQLTVKNETLYFVGSSCHDKH